MQPKIITDLKDTIRQTHGCEALYVNTVYVRKTANSPPDWDGFVKVFELIGHRKAKRCYAWNYGDGKEIRTVAILESPPVGSPEIAVSLAYSSRSGLSEGDARKSHEPSH